MYKITLPYLTLPYPYLHSSPKSILYCIIFSFFPFPIIRNCCLPCLSVLSMHLAAWLSVLSCLVRLISLVHLVYLSCLIFPSRYFISKDLVDDLTYMCTSAISVVGTGRREKVINAICSCSFACSSSSFPLPLPIPPPVLLLCRFLLG